MRSPRVKPRGGVGAGGSARPHFEIAGGERDVARDAGGAAGRIDADDLVAGRGAMGSDGLVAAPGLAQLVLFGGRQSRDVGEAADGGGVGEAGGARVFRDRSASARTDRRSGRDRRRRPPVAPMGRSRCRARTSASQLGGVLDRRFARGGKQEADRRFALLAEMGDQPGACAPGSARRESPPPARRGRRASRRWSSRRSSAAACPRLRPPPPPAPAPPRRCGRRRRAPLRAPACAGRGDRPACAGDGRSRGAAARCSR